MPTLYSHNIKGPPLRSPLLHPPNGYRVILEAEGVEISLIILVYHVSRLGRRPENILRYLVLCFNKPGHCLGPPKIIVICMERAGHISEGLESLKNGRLLNCLLRNFPLFKLQKFHGHFRGILDLEFLVMDVCD